MSLKSHAAQNITPKIFKIFCSNRHKQCTVCHARISQKITHAVCHNSIFFRSRGNNNTAGTHTKTVSPAIRFSVFERQHIISVWQFWIFKIFAELIFIYKFLRVFNPHANSKRLDFHFNTAIKKHFISIAGRMSDANKNFIDRNFFRVIYHNRGNFST